QPGSIVRVKLTNFVTYTAAEFRLRPNLNMIIGPNGTGKSTLVCAICLGLGWHPRYIGRAKEPGEFVKKGASEAEIEIELAAGLDADRNPVIRRVVKREGNRNSYFIDGKAVRGSDVKAFAQRLSIQIDNLCQFLPQERAVEFAAQDSVALLRSTQQAAAPAYMLEWHDTLKELSKAQRDKQSLERTDKEELGKLQARQKAQEQDVLAFRARSDLVTKLEAFEAFRPFVGFRDTRSAQKDAEQKIRDTSAEFEQLKDEIEPSLHTFHAKKEYADKIARAVQQRRNHVDRADARAGEVKRKHDDIDTRISKRGDERDAEFRDYKQRNGQVKHIERIIVGLQKRMDEGPIQFDAAEFTQRAREKEQGIRERNNDLANLQADSNSVRQEALDQQNIIARADQESQELRSQAGQQIGKLRKLSPDTAKAWAWLQEHQDKFSERIYGPPVVECSIKHQNSANAVESVLQRNDLLAFTCTSRADYRVLMNDLCGREGLGLSDITVRVTPRKFEDWQKPI
ncbi:MAG: AAA family ATPase, partial [Terriglobus roseus]|nr:AAA family ATPase [Terriglobus roseus]